MDYKEKYEMALEGIQEILGSGEDSIKMSRLQLRLQGIFPELKENEDEKIRKALINGFKDYKGWDEEWFDGITVREAIAWLEKQSKDSPVLSNSSNVGKIERKPAWSEEDEAMRKTTILYLENTKDSCAAACVPYIVKCINWLKSLRPHSTWKPNGFHLECVSDAIAIYEKRGINAIGLKEILEELKKLREE